MIGPYPIHKNADRARDLAVEACRIAAANPGADWKNIWHTLILLDEAPVDRLRWSLLNGGKRVQFPEESS